MTKKGTAGNVARTEPFVTVTLMVNSDGIVDPVGGVSFSRVYRCDEIDNACGLNGGSLKATACDRSLGKVG